MTNTNTILFLLINYFNEKEVYSFVKEQLQLDINEFIKVIIINNAGNESILLQDIEQKFPSVSLLNAGKNLGYFGAANFGLIHYLNQHKNYPSATVVCNTDITLQSGFFEKLQNILINKKTDILGPSIYSGFLKYYQNPYILNRISKNKLKSLYFLSSNYILYSLFTLYHLLKTKLKGYGNEQIIHETKPYAIHGSFMIFNDSFFEKGGTLNYPSLLFGEEIFVAEQALKLKLNMLYEPDLQIIHNEHATTGIFKSRQTVTYLHQSYKYLLKAF